MTELFSQTPTAHGSVRVTGTLELPVEVDTPREQWAYAVSFARTSTGRDENAALAIHVTMRVKQGSVNVGLLNSAATDFIAHKTVDESVSPVVVELLTVTRSDVGSVVVRNARADGPSRVRVLEIQVVEIQDPDQRRPPSLSSPRPAKGWNRYYGTAGDSLLERVRVARFEALCEPVTLGWRDGFSFRIVPHDQLSRAVYISGTYEPNTLAVLRSFLRPGDVLLDVGANAGIVALAASRWVGPSGRVYAFEPSEREFGRLLDTIHRNPGAAVHPVRVAVSDRSDVATLLVAKDGTGGLNTLAPVFPYDGVDVARIETVQTMTLDDFVEDEAIHTVRAIKLDIEGAEGLALRGATRLLARDRPVLVLEVFSRSLEGMGWSVRDLERLLVEAGYGLYAIDENDASLVSLGSLERIDETNVVAMPA